MIKGVKVRVVIIIFYLFFCVLSSFSGYHNWGRVCLITPVELDVERLSPSASDFTEPLASSEMYKFKNNNFFFKTKF
jgi:hypothetical protein